MRDYFLIITCASNGNAVSYFIEIRVLNPFNPEFTSVIFIRYKPRIAVAIPNL